MKGMPKKTAVAAMIVLVGAVLFLTVSCRRPPAETKTEAGVHRSFEKAPVRVDMDVDRTAITVADRLTVQLTASAPAGYEADLPAGLPEPKEKNATAFHLVDASEPSLEVAKDGLTRTRRTYVLEPDLAGAYTIPALTVHFRKAGEDKETSGRTIDTAEIPVTVASLLPAAASAGEMKPHDIRPPAPLPVGMAAWYWTAGIAAGLLLAGLGGFWVVRKRRSARLIAAEIVIPPHEAAFSALDRLLAANLIEKGEIKAFYQEISGILRRYIEARFGLRAPEQTTEEFLDGLRTGEALDVRYQGLLKQFLTHCDLVKFAAHLPTDADIRNSVDSCRRFIAETRPAETKEMV